MQCHLVADDDVLQHVVVYFEMMRFVCVAQKKIQYYFKAYSLVGVTSYLQCLGKVSFSITFLILFKHFGIIGFPIQVSKQFCCPDLQDVREILLLWVILVPDHKSEV